MGAPVRLTAFAVALVAVFGLSFGIGRLSDEPSAPRDQLHEDAGEGGAGDPPAAGDDHADGGTEGDH